MTSYSVKKIFIVLLIIFPIIQFGLGNLTSSYTRNAYAAEPKNAPEEKKDVPEKKTKKPAPDLKLKEALKEEGAVDKPKEAAPAKKDEHAPAEPKPKEPEPEKSAEPAQPEPKPEKPKLPDRTATLSPEMFQMMETIERKNQELKKREEDLQLKEQALKTLEQQVRGDLEKIERAIVKSQEQFGLKEGLIEKNINSLVKVYSAMKPDEAAAILGTMEEDIAVSIISRMKSKNAGQILSKIGGKTAKNISERIAGKETPKSSP